MEQKLTGSQRAGHLLAIGTIMVWGLTFVNSTIVLETLSPVQLLIARMVVGIVVLTVLGRKRLVLKERKHELYLMAVGFFNVTMYFVLENTALTYTSSGNCAIIVSSAPLFIAIFASVFLKEEKLSPLFFVGFVLAIAGLGLVSLAGQQLELNPLGDLLSLLTAISWAIGTMFMRKLEKHQYNTILVTRRMFMYGVLFALPLLLVLPTKGQLSDLLKPEVYLNVLFLGVIASAVCYVTWMTAMKRIGVVRSGTYIYLVPVVAMLGAAVILGDEIHPLSAAGAALTLAGLFISQKRGKQPGKQDEMHIEETTMHAG